MPDSPSLLRPTASDRPPRVLWIGRRGGRELAPCWSLANAPAQTHHAADAEQALARLVEPLAWDLVVAACPAPVADPRALARLAAAAPSRVIQLLGVWCEGEGRTGHVVEGVERVFWHAWPLWWRRRWGAAECESVETAISVVSRDKELIRGVADSLASAGWSVDRDVQAAGVVLFDGVQLAGAEADRLAAVCHDARRRGASVIALLDFPRPETVAAARAIGADAVLGKPIDLDQLQDAIAQATSLATTRATPQAASEASEPRAAA